MNIKEWLYKKWPKSVTVQAAIIGILGVLLAGVFSIVAAIISKPCNQLHFEPVDVAIKIQDKNTGLMVPNAEIHISPEGILRDSLKKEEYHYSFKKNIPEKLDILIKLPVDSLFLDTTRKQAGKVYESVLIESK